MSPYLSSLALKVSIIAVWVHARENKKKMITPEIRSRYIQQII